MTLTEFDSLKLDSVVRAYSSTQGCSIDGRVTAIDMPPNGIPDDLEVTIRWNDKKEQKIRRGEVRIFRDVFREIEVV